MPKNTDIENNCLFIEFGILMNAILIPLHVSFIIGGDIIEGNIIGEDVDICGPSLASRK